MTELESLLLTFYTVPRAGQYRLSDGGGPFGFDVTTALQVESLIRAYKCDGLVETGCHLGDTTEYLARRYPGIPLQSCDLDYTSATFTRARLRQYRSVLVHHGDSADLLPSMLAGYTTPLIFLDAHWEEKWPLPTELASIQRGVVVLDDFYIDHPRFGYDRYDGIACGPQLVADSLPDLEEIFVGNPYADYPVPCLQVGRRSGTGYIAINLDSEPMRDNAMFQKVPIRPQLEMPDWASLGSKSAHSDNSRHCTIST